jgi:5-methylcytosine-specific restriction protein A
MFTVGEIYRRRELHEKYGGQEQGGISTPANHKFILLFTGDRGKEHGYSDEWKGNRVFLYTGEGQRDDMTFTRGNKAIRDHLEDGKELHLFENRTKGYVEYVGQMVFTGYHYEQGTDTDGNARQMIVFELKPVE